MIHESQRQMNEKSFRIGWNRNEVDENGQNDFFRINYGVVIDPILLILTPTVVPEQCASD